MQLTENDPRPDDGNVSAPDGPPAFHSVTRNHKTKGGPDVIFHEPRRRGALHRTFNATCGADAYCLHQGVGLTLDDVIASEAIILDHGDGETLDEGHEQKPRSTTIYEGLVVAAIVHSRVSGGIHAVKFDDDGLPTVMRFVPRPRPHLAKVDPDFFHHKPSPLGNGRLPNRRFYAYGWGLCPSVREGLGLTLDDVLASESAHFADEDPGAVPDEPGEPHDRAIFDDRNHLLAVIRFPEDGFQSFEVIRFDRAEPAKKENASPVETPAKVIRFDGGDHA